MAQDNDEFDMTGDNSIFAEELAGIIFFAITLFLTEQASLSIFSGVFGAGFFLTLNKYFKSGVKE